MTQDSAKASKKLELSHCAASAWFGAEGQPGNHKSYRTKQMGLHERGFSGQTGAIGILSTWSDLNSCHTHSRSASRR